MSKEFVNPYNFVDLPKMVQRENGEVFYKDKELYMGVMECRLITKTPLCIPDPEKVKVEQGEHNGYGTLKNSQDHLLIQGSSLRGVLRSVYETASESCFSTLKEDMGMHQRRNQESAFKPGILRQTGTQWQLYSALDYKLPDTRVDQNGEIEFQGEKLSHGEKISFSIRPGKARKVENLKGNYSGYVNIGMPFDSKKGEKVFVEKDKLNIDGWLIHDAMERLDEVYEAYRNPSINRSENVKNFYKGYKNAKDEGTLPVWYNQEKKNLQFSLASIGRVFGNKTLNELVGEADACTDRDALCPACLLFGNESGKGFGSRVRITDALSKDTDKIAESVTLKELAGPKYSYLPFYAKYEGNGKQNTFGYDEKGVELRGHKFYWHHPELKEDDYKTSEKTKRNTTMDLVQAGTTCAFKVYYDGITKDQKDQLIWTLNLGENTVDGTHCHKIGYGKPIGLGSVKIVVDKVIERSIKNGYSRVDEVPSQETNNPFRKDRKDAHSLDQLETILNFDELKGCKISYPWVKSKGGNSKNEDAAHQWFRKNQFEENQKLPDILEVKNKQLTIKSELL